MKVFTWLVLLFVVIFGGVRGQKMTSNDSSLVRNYWNKITVEATESKNNYLYAGIDNTLKITFPDENSKKLQLYWGVNNGQIFRTGDLYLTIPRKAGWSFVTTYCITENNDTLVLGKKQFIVKNIPAPTLLIGNTHLCENCTVDRKAFYTGDTLKIFFTDDYAESNQWVSITNFSVGYSYGGMYLSVNNEGSVLLPHTVNFIQKLKPGQQTVIKVIATTPTRMLRQMPLTRFSVL